MVSALVAATLAACGDSGSGSGSEEELDVWVYQDASTAVQERFVEQFNAESDIDINLVPVPGDTYQVRVGEAMREANPPDIFFNWGSGSISEFVEDGLLLDLSDQLESDQDFENAFVPNILEGAVIDGHYYGVPMRGVQPVILFYNQTLFADNGLEPPETFDDFLGLVDTFSSLGVTPVALGGGDAWTELMWLETLLDRYAGPYVFGHIQNGETGLWGDQGMRWAVDMVEQLVDAGAFGDNYTELTYTDDAASTYFAEGNAAMHLMGSWEYANQLANQPEFAENDLAYMPFPEISDSPGGDARTVVGNPSNYWSVHASLGEEGQEDRLAAALEFLELSASPEYSQALIDNGDVPTTTNAKNMLGSHPNPEYARFQYDLVSLAPSFQQSWDQALPPRQAEPMMAAIQQLFSGEISPDEFIDQMLRNV
ncbi:extracellular solute-binding protein [Streptomyces sp. 4N509B]|uniref:extracellular solute-binding protein n=1 Tax=Streptomyces sp. 4N509B TaxID=3457413 RepID=UPI003FD39B66